MFYGLNGEKIGYFDKNSGAFPKANYEFVVSVGGKSISIDKFHNLYKSESGTYFIGYEAK